MRDTQQSPLILIRLISCAVFVCFFTITTTSHVASAQNTPIAKIEKIEFSEGASCSPRDLRVVLAEIEKQSNSDNCNESQKSSITWNSKDKPLMTCKSDKETEKTEKTEEIEEFERIDTNCMIEVTFSKGDDTPITNLTKENIKKTPLGSLSVTSHENLFKWAKKAGIPSIAQDEELTVVKIQIEDAVLCKTLEMSFLNNPRRLKYILCLSTHTEKRNAKILIENLIKEITKNPNEIEEFGETNSKHSEVLLRYGLGEPLYVYWESKGSLSVQINAARLDPISVEKYFNTLINID